LVLLYFNSLKKYNKSPDGLHTTATHVLREPEICDLSNVLHQNQLAACVTTTHNSSPKVLALITPEHVEKVKRAMRTDKDPQWYLAY
jgi:hypothetical protein